MKGLFVIFSSLFAVNYARSVLMPNEFLLSGECRHSPNKKYSVCLSSSEFAIYNNEEYESCWYFFCPKTKMTIVKTTSHTIISANMQNDGNFVVYGKNWIGEQLALWSSQTENYYSNVQKYAKITNHGTFEILDLPYKIDKKIVRYGFVEEPEYNKSEIS